MSKNGYISAIAGIVLSGLLSGCFTGVESTPKITASDVKKENVTITPEQTFLTDIKGEAPSAWESGKRFFVTDDRISQLTSMQRDESLEGKYITLKEIRNVNSITGEAMAEIVFTTPNGKEMVYRPDIPANELPKRNDIEIPFTIEESVVNEVANRLTGKTYYIVTPIWYDTSNQSQRERKFVPVTIKEVKPGNTVYPILLVLEDENHKPFHLFLSVGSDLKAPRGFNNLFSFGNPREKYPTITDKVWDNIIHGKVALDMTREECRLSLGQPAQVDRRHGYGYQYEIWMYENGIYLIFEDGLLREYRK